MKYILSFISICPLLFIYLYYLLDNHIFIEYDLFYNSDVELFYNSDVDYMYGRSNTEHSIKRRVIWSVWEIHKDQYSDYKEFKENWDPNTSLRKLVAQDVKVEIEKIQRKLHQSKKTFLWFLNRK